MSILKKILLLLLISVVFIEFTGCYSTRSLTISEISPANIYLVHYGSSFFHVNNLVLTEGTVKGELVVPNSNNGSIRNHIYLANGAIIQTDNNFISIPAEGIEKIENKVISSGKTVTAILGVLGGALFVYLVSIWKA